MKKKVMAAVLAGIMAAGMLAGCGSSGSSGETQATAADTGDAAQEAETSEETDAAEADTEAAGEADLSADSG